MKVKSKLIFLSCILSFNLSAQQERLSMNKGWSFKYVPGALKPYLPQDYAESVMKILEQR